MRRRRVARAYGRCTVCLRRPALESFTVCLACNESAKVRVRLLRQRRATEKPQRAIVLQLESAGDIAAAHYFYPEALVRYQEALRSTALWPEGERRVAEKYAAALFHSNAPEKAREWFERALQSHRAAGVGARNAEAAGTLLLRLSRQYWLDAETLSALPLLDEAIRLARISRSEAFGARANLAMAHYLILLGRHRSAVPFFEAAGSVGESDPPEVRAVSLDQRAILHAATGERERAYNNFEAAAETSKQLPGGYWITSVWDDFGIWALALGDMATAQLCRERALFVARERHIGWRIPYLSLRYADLLLELEEYERSRDLVLDALTYDCATPCIKILMTSVGIRLASALDDGGLLRRCVDERALDYAFESGEPARIGPLVSAMVRHHVARGEVKKATGLLEHGLSALLSADHAWDILVDAASIGSSAAQRTARNLLKARAVLPCGDVAAAYLDVFDAILARQRDEMSKQQMLVKRAARTFHRIGFVAQERFALSFAVSNRIAGRAEGTGARSFRTMLGDPSALTKREAEVADLALRGFTNRAIARELSISEHTVESHMTSIMNRLGIRSRHQLSNMMLDSGKAGLS